MLVEFREVDKIYAGGRAALKDVSFSLERGEFAFKVFVAPVNVLY